MIEAGWKEAQVKDIRDDRSHKQRFIDGLSAALTPHGEEAAAMAPESHSKASEIIAAIRHQLEINVQIAEQNSPEGPIVDGKRVKGLTHSQDILAQHIRDHLSELELVIATLAPQQHVEGLPLASDIEKLGGWTLSHDFVDQLARKAEEETTYPCPMEVAEHIALTVAGILRSSPPPQHHVRGIDQATIDRVAAAIDSAELGYSMRQVRLVDGINTYTLTIDGMPTEEFTDNDGGGATDQVYARIREVKQRKQAEAVIAALTGSAPQHHERCRDCDGYNCDDGCAFPDPAPEKHLRGDSVFPSKEEIHHLAKLALEEMQREATTDPAAWIASYERVIIAYRRLSLSKQQASDSEAWERANEAVKAANALQVEVDRLRKVLADMLPPDLPWRRDADGVLIHHKVAAINAARAALASEGQNDG
ncbi:hypothetical protein [Neorhizobium sp. S3-V5DH]|uniref:hypothetical protein n=1 Tax=Neorhizobium sp. S3-V5DH TaxID=2485166 RepID=UPI00104DBD96|nr:hypothetical protein [Neorhizobium sp. S3-V5DH]